ncbi:hypothetical protein HVW95_19460 [Escherichia coli]|nr:hypothetical protein HVW96_19460 [Escherichia coli]QMM82254.1 hypothetical protein HVW95_19460 [Escherichia coli]
MKAFLVIFLFIVPFCSSANDLSLVPGVYHLEWAYGPNDNYKIVPGAVGDVHKIDGAFYLKNITNFQSNDAVYIVIGNDSSIVFYEHDETEGGPTIGWANIHANKKMLIINNPTIKDFYDTTFGDSALTIKYKVGVKFSGAKFKNTIEIVPVEMLKNDAFKVDCNEYFKLNKGYGSGDERNDPARIYSGSVLLNYNGLCNYIANKHNKIELLNGWMLFKRIG